MAGDWKATALKTEVWIETVTEGGRRFMAAWRNEGGCSEGLDASRFFFLKKEVDVARDRQEKREATGLGNLSQTGV